VASGQPVARRSFFKSSSVKFFFNRGTTAVVVLAASDVDKTNQSYYGDTALHYLACDGSNECTVPLSESCSRKVASFLECDMVGLLSGLQRRWYLLVLA
jgi:uncharacterized protein with WD repeat